MRRYATWISLNTGLCVRLRDSSAGAAAEQEIKKETEHSSFLFHYQFSCEGHAASIRPVLTHTHDTDTHEKTQQSQSGKQHKLQKDVLQSERREAACDAGFNNEHEHVRRFQRSTDTRRLTSDQRLITANDLERGGRRCRVDRVTYEPSPSVILLSV